MSPAPSLTDTLAVLMGQVQRGDEAAFGELYALTYARTAQVVACTMRAPEHSAEVVQDVFLHAWQHARSYDASRGSVLGWLGMLAHRRAVDRVRHVVRATARDRRGSFADEPVADASELGIARHEAGELHAALQTLSSRQRDAVALTFLQGYSHREAAFLLEVPLGTLKTRVRDGVASLRRCLGALPV